MIKQISKVAAIFLLGIIGGILGQFFVFSFLIDNRYFLEKLPFLKQLKERQVIVNPKEEIFIEENTALTKAIEKVEKTVAGVKSKSPDNQILEGSGLLVTSDGLLLTLASLVPRGSEFYFYLDNKFVAYQILKRDLEKNLALVKISDEKTNSFPTIGWADNERTKLGKRIFLVANSFNPIGSKFIEEGIIRSIGEDYFLTNISAKENLQGSPLFDIEGRAIGLNFVENGKMITIPIQNIRSFLGF